MKVEPAASAIDSGETTRPQKAVKEAMTQPAPNAESVEAFRTRMVAAGSQPRAESANPETAAAPGEAKAEARTGAAGAPESGHWQPYFEHSGNGMSTAQHAPPVAPPPTDAAPAVAGNAASFAALLERHVRAMLVSSEGLDRCGAQMLLRLDGDELGGTDLLLTRTGEGWLLEATARNQSVLDAIRDTAGELEESFDTHNLGTLAVRAALRDG